MKKERGKRIEYKQNREKSERKRGYNSRQRSENKGDY